MSVKPATPQPRPAPMPDPGPASPHPQMSDPEAIDPGDADVFERPSSEEQAQGEAR